MRETIHFAKVKPDAIIPFKKDENAGYDVYLNFEEDYKAIRPHTTVMLPTGIASACSEDYYFQILERGSTGTKGIGQRCGVIDSGYRGEWFIPITNHNDYYLVIAKEVDVQKFHRQYGNFTIVYPYSKAICQAVLLPVPKTNVKEVTLDELLTITSERGEGKLGSSNK